MGVWLIMAVVAAFQVLNPHAGLTCYFRAAGCTSMTISDCLPLLSKITTYADEYIIGEMLIFDRGSQSVEPNNCVMCRVIIYNDGWICTWFDKESQNQGGISSCPYVDAQTLSGLSAFCDYPDKWNGCYLKITGSTDTDCPVGTTFTIRDTDEALGRIIVHEDYSPDAYHFNTGYNYDVEVYMSNGNLMWWGVSSGVSGDPPLMSNRLYRAIYELWQNLKYRSNSTAISYEHATGAYRWNDPNFSDDTFDFNYPGVGNEVTLIRGAEVIDDAFYYGLTQMFNGVKHNITTAGVGNTIVWEYWDGSAWSSLSTTDNTSGYTVLGTNSVTFTPPADWTIRSVNSSPNYYWIRSRVTVAAYTTSPILEQGWMNVPSTLVYTDANLGMYSFEDTSAKYCLLCGKMDDASWFYFYNTVLLGKTIYNHVVNWSVHEAYTGMYVNDTEVSDSHYADTNGHININIEAIDAAVGTQNVFKKQGGSYAYQSKIAAILITD